MVAEIADATCAGISSTSRYNPTSSFKFVSDTVVLTSVGQAYTAGIFAPLAVHNGKYCIYSGDLNKDGWVTGDDFTFIDNNNTNIIHREVPH